MSYVRTGRLCLNFVVKEYKNYHNPYVSTHAQLTSNLKLEQSNVLVDDVFIDIVI